jgi:coenzyme F420-dependent glucose-6-phosphate dehydrogenase
MGIMESVRAVMWARKRQPDQVAYGIALGHERFGPRELLDQAVAAERAGFDLVCCSDHLAPWWEPAQGPPAHCANGWVWLGGPPRRCRWARRSARSCTATTRW